MGEREVVESCSLDHFDGYRVLQMTYISDFMKKSEAKRVASSLCQNALS